MDNTKVNRYKNINVQEIICISNIKVNFPALYLLVYRKQQLKFKTEVLSQQSLKDRRLYILNLEKIIKLFFYTLKVIIYATK